MLAFIVLVSASVLILSGSVVLNRETLVAIAVVSWLLETMYNFVLFVVFLHGNKEEMNLLCQFFFLRLLSWVGRTIHSVPSLQSNVVSRVLGTRYRNSFPGPFLFII